MSSLPKCDRVIFTSHLGETKAEARKKNDLTFREEVAKLCQKQGDGDSLDTRLLLASGLCPAQMKSRFQCLPVGTGCLWQAGILMRSPVVFPASPPPSFAGTGMNGKREALSGLCSPSPVAAEFQITPQTKPTQAAPCAPLSPLSLAFSPQAWQHCCSSVARHMRGGEDGRLCRPSLCSGVWNNRALCLVCLAGPRGSRRKEEVGATP